MAFERYSINKNPNGGRIAYRGDDRPRPRINRRAGEPQTGGELPPYQRPDSGFSHDISLPPNINPRIDLSKFPTSGMSNLMYRTAAPAAEDPATPPPTDEPAARQKIGKGNFQRAFQAWFDNKWKNGGHSVFAGFGDGAMMMGRGGKGNGAGKKPTEKPPAKPTPQWAFQPNPLDQPSYQTPMGPASQYTVNPPAQPWMFDPATSGQGAPPQWYGQPTVPNSQPPFRS